MEKLRVIKLEDEGITFDNGVQLSSNHDQDCCEQHYLSFTDLVLADFDGLQFDLTKDTFFKRVLGYGIELIPINWHPVRVAGYGSNNGYYSSELTLVLTDEKRSIKYFDITECQVISD